MDPELSSMVKGVGPSEDALRECFESLIELYEYLTDQPMKINQKILELCRSPKYQERARLLGRFPG